MLGYCLKCRTKVEMADIKPVVMKNGRNGMQGFCSKCGTKMFIITKIPEKIPENRTERENEIRMMAYYLWEREGCHHGHDRDHWIQAESIWNEKSAQK